MPKPIRRAESLRPLSREHHHGLLFCWKIRTGIKNGVDPVRMKNYAVYFFNEHLHQHFIAEEVSLFPILGKGHSGVRQAIDEHNRLRELFSFRETDRQTLDLIADELDRHIRFEERVLFNEIQEVASAEQLSLLDDLHREVPEPDNWQDPFWEYPHKRGGE